MLKIQMEDRHDELKTALRLLNQSQTSFAASLINPTTGKIGVSPTYLYHVSIGQEESAWVEKKIYEKIRQAKEEVPESMWEKQLEKTKMEAA